MSTEQENEIAPRVVACVRSVLPRRRRDAAIEVSSRLADFMDSLVLIDFLTSLEKEFGVRLSAERLREVRLDTVADAITLVAALAAAPAGNDEEQIEG